MINSGHGQGDSDLGGDEAALAAMLLGQRRAITCVGNVSGAIARAAQAISERLRRNGRLIYLGAGSSGLIALQDGAELPGTFGIAPDRIVLVMAGGLQSAFNLAGSAEDDIEAAVAAVASLGDLRADAVIALSASGTTPYTLAGARAAISAGALLVAIASRPGAPLLSIAQHPILLDTGPEFVDGSTRMAAGTAQKCALTLLSTLVNMKLGHVHDGMMVNVRADNSKLHERSVSIVAKIAQVDHDNARHALKAANGGTKVAVLICAGASRAAAQEILESCRGDLGASLEILRSGPVPTRTAVERT